MKQKIKTWLKRYLPAEIIGTICAVALPTTTALLLGNTLLIAFIGAWGENVGFYGTMITQEVMETRRKYKETGKKYGYIAFMKNIRNIFLEFGIAETADSLLIRPAAMYAAMKICNNIPLGIFVGKIAADVLFYIPTVISYELRKKHIKD